MGYQLASLTVTYTPGDISNFEEEDINPVVVPGVVSVLEYKAGDINGDDRSDADDLITLTRHVAHIELITDSDKLKSADVDGDKSVTAADLTALARLIK